MSWFSDITNVDFNLMDTITGESATNRAIDAQADAAKYAADVQRQMYDQTREDLAPWRQAGQGALSQLTGRMDDLNRPFSMADFTADPGYQFRMQEGMKALERSAAARGGRMSGGTLKALTRYGQDFAANEYTNAYNRFNADRERTFNRLASLAGVGQTTSSQLANANAAFGQGLANTAVGLGNSQAAAHIGQANRVSNLIGQGITAGIIASDRRLKTDVHRVSKEDLEELRRSIKPYMFKYASSKHGAGQWVGVMAQDLEKSKLGRTVVVEKDGVKMVDFPKLQSLLVAAMAKG